jgi:hypothetical protein
MKRSTKPMARGSKRLTAGKKTKRWAAERRTLVQKFAAMGITSCELRYEGCWNDNALGFAHAAKRRKLREQDLDVVILACNPCHDHIEFLAPEEMERIVNETISSRQQVSE